MPVLVAETRNPSVSDLHSEEFAIHFLSDLLMGDREEMLLCPDKEVKQYSSRTEQYCRNCNNLFISTGQVKKKIRKNTIDFWIKVINNVAHRMAAEGDCTVIKARAHKVTVFALFLLFKKNFVVQQMIWLVACKLAFRRKGKTVVSSFSTFPSHFMISLTEFLSRVNGFNY